MDTLAPKTPKSKPYVYHLQYPESMGGSIFYIGKGTKRRIYEHETEARSTRKVFSNPYKIRIIRQIWRQGEQFVKAKIAEFISDEEAYLFEFALIFFMQGYGNLTNITDGGLGGIAHIMRSKPLSEEHKRKIGEANRGKPSPNKGKTRPKEIGQKISLRLTGRIYPNRRKIKSLHVKNKPRSFGMSGKKHTEEALRKMRTFQKGHPVSEETKRKISERTKGRIHSEASIQKRREALSGRPLSEEHKRKVSESLKGRSPSEEHRQKLSEANKGKVYSEERRRNMSQGRREANERRKSDDK